MVNTIHGSLKLIVLLLFVTSCAPARLAVIDASNEYIANVEVMREVAENCRSGSQLQIGFIKAALGSSFEELPQEDIKAIDELMQLAEETELSDYKLGRLLGLQLRLSISATQKIFEKYAPNVVNFLPFAF